MNKRLPSFGFVIALALSSISSSAAAAPTVNALFPAGGQRGTTVSVTADGTFSRWPVQVWVEGKGIDVQPSNESGKLIVTIAADAIPGAYAIRLYDDEGASVARPFIVGTLPEVMEREPNDDFQKPQVLDETCVTVNGRLGKPGDVDTFSLALKKGQMLVASMDAHRTLRSPMDGHLQIVSPDGFVLDHNDDFHGLDPQIVFLVPKDGIYLVRTFAFPAVPDSSIRFAGGDKFIYRLTLTTGAFFDYPYPLAVPRSDPDRVHLVGWNLPPSLRRLTVVPIDDSEKVAVYHRDCANAMPVRLVPHAATARDATSPEHPQKIELPITITGRIEHSGDVDYYQFDGKKGARLAFRAEAQSLGFPLDPVLTISEKAGKTLAKAQSAALDKDPILDFAVPHDGPFILTVRDLFGAGTSRHVYLLHAEKAKPDFALTLATDRFVVRSGKPLDVPVTVERFYGFKDAIELGVAGLRKGVTAVTLPADTKAKTLTLRLTADKISYSGPVRVVGKTSEEVGLRRIARATVADLGTVTEILWLTVAK
jgi:hypothetical protein